MKKIAILGSGNGSNFEAIVNYFNGKDVEIICISDVEDAYILKRAGNLDIPFEYLPFEKNFEYFLENKFDVIVLAGYMRVLPDEVIELGKFINIHPSLLPAFKGKDAIKQAFLAGVKVSGVTVHYVDADLDGGKIIAQYPVLIGNLTHFDEYKKEIHNLEHMLYPIVIEKVLNDEVFDFQDLLGGGGCSKSGGCGGGCSGCH